MWINCVISMRRNLISFLRRRLLHLCDLPVFLCFCFWTLHFTPTHRNHCCSYIGKKHTQSKRACTHGHCLPSTNYTIFVTIFSFFAVHFVSAKENPMLTATPNPKIGVKTFKLLTLTPNRKKHCLMTLLLNSFVSL